MSTALSSETPATDAPLTVGKVVLTVHDLDRVSAFYEQAVGLHLLRRDAATAELGATGRTLIELRGDKAARRSGPREAGLFHTAFLLPARSDLARWARHAAATRVPLAGLSDHVVSEAIYLSDPEGNGIEVYADRSPSSWTWKDGQVQMSTDWLDAESLLADAGAETWRGFPAPSVVGHVHLKVGNISDAEEFYAGALGLDITCRYPGATFFSSGGYHHHIATNIWNSRGAAPRAGPATGLEEVELLASRREFDELSARVGKSETVTTNESALSLRDPWGTTITVRPR
jgi:catechol 2,3-dioxygenase